MHIFSSFIIQAHIQVQIIPKQAKRRLRHHSPRKSRHLVEKREEKWRFFREERKAV